MPADHKGHSPVTGGGSRAISAGYRVFNINEVAFVESAVDILISADPVGPALPSWAWRPISIGKWPEATARQSVVSGRSIRRGNGTTRISIADDYF